MPTSVTSIAHFPLIAWLIILLGIAHGALYALTIPPWGLLDEQQHFHYIQFLAQEHRLPRMWHDKLSPEIITSIFSVKRHVVTLNATAMPTRADFMASLEAESYEAYHPPLYYLSLSGLYILLPHDILSQLFLLRLLGVMGSSITLIIIWQSCQTLWPERPGVAVMATLFIALHPEKAAATARLSNDIGLEISCALAFGCWIISLKQGLNRRLAAQLGLYISVAILTKLSALIIIVPILLGWGMVAYNRKLGWSMLMTQFGFIITPVVLTISVIFSYNWLYYGDLTGLGAFIRRVGPLTSSDNLTLLWQGLKDLSHYSWVILWAGGQVTSKFSATLLILSLNLHLLMLALVLGYKIRTHATWLTRITLALSFLTLGAVISSTLSAYMQGFIPLVQARFLLPTLLPTAWLVGFSINLLPPPWHKFMAFSLFTHELLLSLSVLFFHSLPQFYAPRQTGFLGYSAQTVYLFLNPHGIFSDKPVWVNLVSVGWVGVIFCGLLLSIIGLIQIKSTSLSQ